MMSAQLARAPIKRAVSPLPHLARHFINLFQLLQTRYEEYEAPTAMTASIAETLQLRK